MQNGPLPAINVVITPISRVISYNITYTHLFSAIYRDYIITSFITGRGSSCGRWMDLLRVASGSILAHR